VQGRPKIADLILDILDIVDIATKGRFGGWVAEALWVPMQDVIATKGRFGMWILRPRVASAVRLPDIVDVATGGRFCGDVAEHAISG
jgi:hypothetical protein